jgi:uncharacterized protein
MKFVADTMIEKLARWLRIFGYDVVSDSSKTLNELISISNKEDRVFLTRRRSFPDGPQPLILFDVRSENFNDQLKRVITQFALDIESNLFTRCVECNVEVKRVNEKQTVQGRIPQKTFEGFDEFFECPICKKVFWRGAHVKNTLKKLNSILNRK